MIPRNPAPTAGRADRGTVHHLGRPERAFHLGQHGPRLSKVRNVIAENVPDQARLVFIGVTIPGLGGLGVAALPFIYLPFHGGRYGYEAIQRTARK